MDVKIHMEDLSGSDSGVGGADGLPGGVGTGDQGGDDGDGLGFPGSGQPGDDLGVERADGDAGPLEGPGEVVVADLPGQRRVAGGADQADQRGLPGLGVGVERTGDGGHQLATASPPRADGRGVVAADPPEATRIV
jgi:hypothetical protein